MTQECQGGPEWVGPILRVVVPTPDLTAAVAAYRDGLGLPLRERGRLPAATARAWSAPLLTGAPWARVGPASRVGGDVQLVQVPPVSPSERYGPLRRYGWAALEVSVPDLDAAVARLTTAFTIIGPPKALTGQAAALRAAQVVGPAGEVLYLTELRRPLPPFQLPRRAAGPAPDGVFIAVLAASDLPASRAWWEGRFRVRRCTDRLATIPVLNRAHGRPAGASSRISSLQLSGRAVVEIDQYPAGLRSATGRSGALPPGVAVVAVAVPDPGSGGRGRVIRGPDGELVELVPAPRPIDVV